MSGKLTSYGLKGAQIVGEISLFSKRKWFVGWGPRNRPPLTEQVLGTASVTGG